MARAMETRKPTMSDDEIILADLSDEELVQQMHDDLYDGLKEEIEEGTNILLERGWAPYNILTEALVEGMRIVGIDFRDGILFVPEVLLAALTALTTISGLGPGWMRMATVSVRASISVICAPRQTLARIIATRA